MRVAAWSIAAIVALALSAPAAVASDASVRAAVRSAENSHLAPAGNAMLRAEKRFEKAQRVAPLRASVKRFVGAIAATRPTIVREAPSSDKVRRGKALFLKMMGDFSLALQAFDRGLAQWQAGHRTSAAELIQRQAKRLDPISRDETRALK